MENTQHSDLLHLHPNGARSFCFDAMGIVPPLARLLRILWKHEGGNQVAEHRADETGAPYKPRIESRNEGRTIGLVPQPPTHLLALCHIGEWAEQRLRTNLRRLARCAGGRAIGQGRGVALRRRAIGQGRRVAPRRLPMRRRAPRQWRIAGPLRVFVVRLLVLRWRGWQVRVPAHVRGRPFPSGSLHNV